MYLYNLISANLTNKKSIGILFPNTVNLEFIKYLTITKDLLESIKLWHIKMIAVSQNIIIPNYWIPTKENNEYYIIPLLDNKINYDELKNINTTQILYDNNSKKYLLLDNLYYYMYYYDINILSNVLDFKIDYQYFILSNNIVNIIKNILLEIHISNFIKQYDINDIDSNDFKYHKKNMVLGIKLFNYVNSLYILHRNKIQHLDIQKFNKEYDNLYKKNIIKLDITKKEIEYILNIINNNITINGFSKSPIIMKYNINNMYSIIGSVSKKSFINSIDFINNLLELPIPLIDFKYLINLYDLRNIINIKFELKTFENKINYIFEKQSIAIQALIRNPICELPDNSIFIIIGKYIYEYYCELNNICIVKNIKKMNYAIITALIFDDGDLDYIKYLIE